MAINLQSLIRTTLVGAQLADQAKVLSSSISEQTQNVNTTLKSIQAADSAANLVTSGLSDAQQSIGSTLDAAQRFDTQAANAASQAAAGATSAQRAVENLALSGGKGNVTKKNTDSLKNTLEEMQASDGSSKSGDYGSNTGGETGRTQSIPWGFDRFSAAVLGNNELSRPNKYYVNVRAGSGIVGNPQFPEERLNLLCNTVQLPNRAIMTSDHRHFNRSVKFAYASVYEPITLTFNSSDDFYERKWLESWMEAIVDTKSGAIKYYDDYIGEMWVYTVDRNGSFNGGVKLHEVYPINISTVDMSYSSMDEITQIACTFNYLYWSRDF